MPSDEPHLPLARYRFTYTAADDLHLPPYPGSLWHAVFGLHLRTLCCVHPGTDCATCPLLHQCRYSLLFSGPRPPDAALMRRYATIPVPHVFQLDAEYPPHIGAGGRIRASLVLVGKANAELPLVIQAMAAAGWGGLGAERARARLDDVTQLPSGDAPSHLVAADGRIGEALPAESPSTPPPPAALRLHFTSPYRAGGAVPADRLEPGPFLMALVRRASLLQYFYTSRQLMAPFADLKATAAEARVIAQDWRAQPATRYAARHGRRLPTGGLLGYIDLDMRGIEPLWPYLHLGQWLNVGKNASMGFGRYEVATLSP
ncbi:Uncharacterized conserved protein (DUF2276) [Thioflavicoccus mobilis 8321]|uniref:Uncharacterized conserved protein (DUF2276) n=1 Tax=Thioflavicoccus mobilis 8321 TaxID=765912 RepID=L0GUX9_9GAMM|nr:CRISPR system precrRNA processing endoribonuclease RAMP protein Cas6 [Thioflavicoccus mobilis]AGA89175.1 Uncharacterized conserved protein (DUF2276) [Thioflavicoccus mobilis 8321]